MVWTLRSFDELSARDVYNILQARDQVFVVEQDSVYLDADGLDLIAMHLLAEQDGEVAAYCRILPENTRFAERSIGRVITTEKFRGQGLGKELMERAIRYLVQEQKAPAIHISGQSYLRRFYEDLGFQVCSEEYLEDGIPHYGMLYTAKQTV